MQVFIFKYHNRLLLLAEVTIIGFCYFVLLITVSSDITSKNCKCLYNYSLPIIMEMLKYLAVLYDAKCIIHELFFPKGFLIDDFLLKVQICI